MPFSWTWCPGTSPAENQVLQPPARGMAPCPELGRGLSSSPAARGRAGRDGLTDLPYH